jgi:hypothetical protein
MIGQKDKIVRRRELLCVGCSRSLYRGWVVGCAVLMLMQRKKMMEKQRRNKEKE